MFLNQCDALRKAPLISFTCVADQRSKTTTTCIELPEQVIERPKIPKTKRHKQNQGKRHEPAQSPTGHCTIDHIKPAAGLTNYATPNCPLITIYIRIILSSTRNHFLRKKLSSFHLIIINTNIYIYLLLNFVHHFLTTLNGYKVSFTFQYLKIQSSGCRLVNCLNPNELS